MVGAWHLSPCNRPILLAQLWRERAGTTITAERVRFVVRKAEQYPTSTFGRVYSAAVGEGSPPKPLDSSDRQSIASRTFAWSCDGVGNVEHVTDARKPNCFDFLRLMAASSVAVGHMVKTIPATSFLWVSATSRFYFSGRCARFFVISGFLVYRSCAHCLDRGQPVWHYFANRFLRIAPAIYAYTVVVVALLLVLGATTVGELGVPRFAYWIGTELALAPDFNPEIALRWGRSHHLNGSLWTISAEVSFYLLVPIFYLTAWRVGFRALMLGIGVLAVLGLIATHYSYIHNFTVLGIDKRIFVFHYVPPYGYPTQRSLGFSTAPNRDAFIPGRFFGVIEDTCVPYLSFFGLGILWSVLWSRARHSVWLATTGAVLYFLVRMANVFHVHSPFFDFNPLYVWAWALPLSYVVIWIAHNGPPALVGFPRRIGDLSYGTYIWHFVVIYTVVYLGIPNVLPAGEPSP